MKLIYILVFTLSLFSCSQQRSLQKMYVGKPQSVLSKEFGHPKAVLDQENEKVYVYEIVKDLKSAQINQGKLSLDPMISPMVEKTERYYFTVKDDKIVKARIEEEYQR
jgi:hypothetical protein